MIDPDIVARAVLDTVPHVMRSIRCEIRMKRAPGLSIPQFRVLNFLKTHHDVTLSEVSEFIGLTLPSMSKMVDGLVERGLISRRACVSDRRKIQLALSENGKELVESVYSYTQSSLSLKIAGLSVDEQDSILDAMRILQVVFP